MRRTRAPAVCWEIASDTAPRAKKPSSDDGSDATAVRSVPDLLGAGCPSQPSKLTDPTAHEKMRLVKAGDSRMLLVSYASSWRLSMEVLVTLVTHEQLEQFERDGFVKFPAFLSATAVAKVNEEVDAFVRTIEPGVTPDVFFDGECSIERLLQIRKLETRSPYFQSMYDKDPFRTVAEQLIGRTVLPFNMHFFTKPPASSSGTPPHQDGYYFMLAEPMDTVTMWVALEAVDDENGCLHYIPGSHRGPLRGHGTTGVVGFSQGLSEPVTEAQLSLGISMPAQPGDMLVHKAKTIHWTPANRSAGRTRRAFGAVFYAADSIRDEPARQAYFARMEAERMAKDGSSPSHSGFRKY